MGHTAKPESGKRTIWITLPDELIERLDEIAASRFTTRTGAVKQLVIEEYARGSQSDPATAERE